MDIKASVANIGANTATIHTYCIPHDAQPPTIRLLETSEAGASTLAYTLDAGPPFPLEIYIPQQTLYPSEVR